MIFVNHIKRYLKTQDGEILGVVVAIGRGRVGWSFIHPTEKRGIISKTKKDRDGNVIKEAVYGIDPKDCTLAIKRAQEGVVAPIPHIRCESYLGKRYNTNINAMEIGKMYAKSLVYFQGR